MRVGIGLLTCVALATCAIPGATQRRPAGTMRIERVFGPETPTGKYKHPASITELANGDLYLVYYGGTGEYAVNTGVFGSRRKRGETKWSPPRLIAHDPFRSVGNGVIWQAPDGLVWLFYVVRWGETWSTSRIQAKVSKDGARAWSDSFVLSDVEGDMVRGRPIVLDTGEYLLPIYHETGRDPERVGADSTSEFLRFNPKTKKWARSGAIRSPKGSIQPAVVQLSHNRLLAYCRRAGGYEPTTDGWMVRAESNDGGHTWSEGANSSFPNPNAAVDLLRLKSGRLVLVYNDSMNERTPLTVSVSSDGGKTWPIKRNLATGPYDYAYPYAIQARDGRIHIVYTSHERSVVNHAVLDEAWLLHGGATTAKSR